MERKRETDIQNIKRERQTEAIHKKNKQICLQGTREREYNERVDREADRQRKRREIERD